MALVAALAAVASAQSGPGGMRYEPGTPTGEAPGVLQEVRFDQRLGAAIPLDALFRDESGSPVTLGTFFGRRPVILALVYYECPMLCTQVLTGLLSALDVLTFDAGREFDVVVVSFNPKEGPGLATAKKRAYVERYERPGAGGGWHFLTGPPESIAQLTQAVGFKYQWDDETRQFAHAAGVMVLTPAGRISKYFYGIEYSPRDLRFGIIEASEQRIGTPADQLLLYCYHYDPTTGKYGFVAMALVRIGGVVTILALVTFWIVMWRSDRRQAVATGAGHRA
jgi:protein SCO1/2